MKRLARCALIAALSLILNPAFAQSDPGSAPGGRQVQILRDSAAGRVVATVYEGRFSWVRIETREAGAAPNQHPFDVAAAALRAMLERVQLADGKREPLFSARQLDEIVAPLAAALGRASGEQDVSLAVSDQFGLFGPLASRAVTTARVFRRDGQLQVIAGLVRRDFESEYRGSGVLIAFEPGQRARPVERGVKLAVTPGGGSQVRDDWIALSTGLAAAAPAATPVPAAPVAATTAPAAATPVAPTPAAVTPAVATPAAPAVAAPTPSVAPPSATASAGAASAAKPGASGAAPAAQGKDADALYRSTAERLRALEKLRKDGLITEAEYQEKRRQILREL